MAYPRLSPREMESLHWISMGKTSWETATILGISEHTINFHVRNLCAKLEAPNRQAAIAIALSAGIIKPIDRIISGLEQLPRGSCTVLGTTV